MRRVKSMRRTRVITKAEVIKRVGVMSSASNMRKAKVKEEGWY